MKHRRLLAITGLPGTGKTTLARLLAQRYRTCLLCKDTIKESLLPVLHELCAPSRLLSDASFASLFALTAEVLAAGVDVIIEGNFRADEHEAGLRATVSRADVRVAQVLCRTGEAERVVRLMARRADGTRHRGHRDADETDRPQTCDRFLEVPGERLLYENGARCDAAASQLFAALDRFFGSAASGS